MIQYSEVTANQVSEYNQLILNGLIKDENSFRIAPEDETDMALPTKGTEDNFTLGAFINDELVGVASFRREGENRAKLRHKGLLFRILVDSNHRKNGIASSLIKEVIDRARNLDGIEQINLTVIPTNAHAKKLYEKFGFVTFASEPKAVKWKGNYLTEDQMKLML
jgi:cyclohexyl-isocyanide hydratase